MGRSGCWERRARKWRRRRRDWYTCGGTFPEPSPRGRRSSPRWSLGCHLQSELRASHGRTYVGAAADSPWPFQETPELFSLPTDVSIMNAAAGWAHCVAVTDVGEVYTWGWKECVPSGKVFGDSSVSGSLEKDVMDKQTSLLTEQVSPRSQGSRSSSGTVTLSGVDGKGSGEESTKRRRVSTAKQAAETSSSSEETLSALSCLVSMNPGVRIGTVAAGGRHTLALSDAGALLAFGWGLYGQCGQGSTDDELSPTCVSSLLGIHIEDVAAGLWHTVCVSADGDVYSIGGNQFGQLGTGTDQAETLPRLVDAPSLGNVHTKTVSCGARHTAVITDDGKVFCWGWNKYGQLGLGDVIDRNIPSQVTVEGCIPKKVACGWWHTLLLSDSKNGDSSSNIPWDLEAEQQF